MHTTHLFGVSYLQFREKQQKHVWLGITRSNSGIQVLFIKNIRGTKRGGIIVIGCNAGAVTCCKMDITNILKSRINKQCHILAGQNESNESDYG